MMFLATTDVPPQLWETLVQFGAVGAVLAWFMWKTEPRLRAMEAAIDRMSKSILLLVVSIPHANDHAKEQSASLIKEIESAEALRGGQAK